MSKKNLGTRYISIIKINVILTFYFLYSASLAYNNIIK